jgi:hypothetical protein
MLYSYNIIYAVEFASIFDMTVELILASCQTAYSYVLYTETTGMVYLSLHIPPFCSQYLPEMLFNMLY